LKRKKKLIQKKEPLKDKDDNIKAKKSSKENLEKKSRNSSISKKSLDESSNANENFSNN
jgi:hypothetical protein